MLRIFRSGVKLFSSEKLKSLKQTYNSNPAEVKPAFEYIRQLLRENQNTAAWTEIYSLNSDIRSSPEIEKLKKVLERRDLHPKANHNKGSLLSSRQRFFLLLLGLSPVALYVYMELKATKSKQIKKKTTKKKKDEEAPTKFADIRGIDEFREELLQVVDYIKDPQKYRKAGAKLPKGILMVGPPGTGKTMMARALANQAGCKFIYKNGSEFDEMFVGIGASRVRQLFQQARKAAPAIIFIDEIDSVAGRRNQMIPHANDTINQLLTEMDGFKQTENIIVIGATNMESAIDPAIKRPGRFDKIINVPLPDIKGREDIFNLYLSKIQYKDAKADLLSRMTFGFSGADIQNMVNLAILNCAREARPFANRKDFEFAYDRIVMGVGRSKLYVTEKDKLITAYHECGHTIIALLTEGATPLHKVTMLPRGGALGFTSMVPETDSLSQTKREILAMIDVCFGGKVAEEIIMGNEQVTSGSSNDLMKATNLAYSYVKKLGMNDKILICQVQGVKLSDSYSSILDKQVQKVLQESYHRVKQQLLSHKDELSLLAMELMRKETMTAEEVKKYLKI